MKFGINDHIESLKLAREKAVTNGWKLSEKAIQLFEKKDYAISCFLAMTAIEEAGKSSLMRQAHNELRALEKSEELQKNYRIFSKLLRNHSKKTVNAAAYALYINWGAYMRHGLHPISRMHITDGIVVLARSANGWMDIRNSCLYTDIKLEQNVVSSPIESITKEHAYYFICMALEIIAEHAECGFGSASEGRDVSKSHDFLDDCIYNLKMFMEKWSESVNIYELDFLKNPDSFPPS
jgi:AbiV family abortive infection protein